MEKIKITIKKHDTHKSGSYVAVNTAASRYAMRELDEGFKLWCYLAFIKFDRNIELTKEACKEAGIKHFGRAVRELIDKGFLVYASESTFRFYEMPSDNEWKYEPPPEDKDFVKPTQRCTLGKGVTIKPDGIHDLDPCLYREVEAYNNVTVRVLKCIRCGHTEVEWERQPDTVEIPMI